MSTQNAKMRAAIQTRNNLELELAQALARMLIRANGNLGQNFYTVPEVKAGFAALVQLVKYSGDWQDLNLHLVWDMIDEEQYRRTLCKSKN